MLEHGIRQKLGELGVQTFLPRFPESPKPSLGRRAEEEARLAEERVEEH